MADLKTAEMCSEALEREWPRLQERWAGWTVVAYYQTNRSVFFNFSSTYEEAEKFQNNLPDDERAGSVISEIMPPGTPMCLSI